MNKKSKLTIAFLLTILVIMSIWVAYSQYQIWSQKITVEVQGAVLTLTSNYTTPILIDATIRFSGYLTQDGSGIQGKTISLYMNNNPTAQTSITDSTGYYQIDWTAQTAGTYKFNTTVILP